MDTPENPYEAPREESMPNHEGGSGEPPPGSAFEAVNRRFFRLLGDSGGPLIFLWGILAVLNLPGQLLNVAAQESLQDGNFSGMMGMTLIFYLLALVVAALNFTAYRAVKAADDTDGDLTLMQAIDTTLSRVVPTLATIVLYGILIFLGSLLCFVPGIYAALAFMPAAFICAVYGYGPIESLKTARSWFHTHITLFLILIGVGFAYGLGLGVIGAVLMFGVFEMNPGQPAGMGYIPTTMVWLLTSALGYFMWLYAGSVYITVGRAEEQFMRRYDMFEG